MYKVILTAGFVAGAVAAGTVGMLAMAGKIKPRKLWRRAAHAVDDAVDDVADCIKHRKHCMY